MVNHGNKSKQFSNGGVRLRIVGFAITLYQESFSFWWHDKEDSEMTK